MQTFAMTKGQFVVPLPRTERQASGGFSCYITVVRHYATTLGRATAAMAIGALLGGAIFSAQNLWGIYIVFGFTDLIQFGIRQSVPGLVFACIVWGMGIFLLGGPIWLILHHRGVRQAWAAVAVGGTLPFIVAMALRTKLFTGRDPTMDYSSAGGRVLWNDGVLTPDGWQSAVEVSLLYALFGSIIGAVIWRIAYRKV